MTDDLFDITPDERPKLSSPENLLRMAHLKATRPERYEELIAKLTKARVPRLRDLEDEVKKMLKQAKDKIQNPATPRDVPDDGFERDLKTGTILPTQHNIRLAIDKLGVKLRYDAFAGNPTIEDLEGFGPTLDDRAENRLWLRVDEVFKFRPRMDFFHSVVSDACMRNQFHPVRDYLDGLSWDGVPRLDSWLVRYCGCEDTPFVRAVGRLTLIAAVRRIRKPGSKHDEMLVFESPEGFNKSTLIRILGVHDDWYSDSLPLNVDDKRMIENSRGKWVVEISELQGMRRGDVGVIKAQLSRQYDRARLAFDRSVSEVPRQFICFGTVNPAEADGYLASLTGNRRFWPVTVSRIDLDAFNADRDQLWAEASAREAQGETSQLDPSLWPAAIEQQRSRETVNPLLERLAPLIGDHEGIVFAEDVWTVLGIPVDRRPPLYEKMGKAMSDLGWDYVKRAHAPGGPKVGAYRRGASQQVLRAVRGGPDYEWTLADDREFADADA